MPYKIQHLGLGGILDQAIALTRNHFGLLFTIALILIVPFQLVMRQVQQLNAPEIPFGSSWNEIMEVLANHEADPALSLLSFVLSAAYFFVLMPLTNATLISAIARLYLGQPVTVKDALRHGVRRLLPVLWATVLVMLAGIAGFFLLVIPAIIFMVWFALTQMVVVIEEVGGTQALRRSKKLVSPNWTTLIALGFILLVITSSLGMIAGVIPQPQVSILVSSLVTAVITIVATAAWVVYYFSCRCAVENFDLFYMADQIGAETPAVGPQPVADGAAV